MIAKKYIPSQPPWTFNIPDINFDLACLLKTDANAHILKALFGEIKDKFKDYDRIYSIQTDLK